MRTEDRRKLEAIAFANLSDYAEWRVDGLRLKDTTHMTPEQRAACVVTRTPGEDGAETIEVSIPGKVEALGNLLTKLDPLKR